MARRSPVGSSSEVPRLEWVARAAERVSASLARDRAGLARLRRHGFDIAARDSDVLARHTRRYSLRLPFGPVEDQGRSGNCWLFAPTVLVRAAALRGGGIAATESFSESYLYFFNLLLRSNAALGRIGQITARDVVRHDTLRRGLSQEVMGLEDGGEWEWAFNLIATYGLVPTDAMPATASWRNTQALNVDLHERLARAARAIAKAPDNYERLRGRALRDVIRILVAHLGTPPTTVKSGRRTLSPSEYAHQVAGFRPADWRVVISNPLLEFGRVYLQRGSAIAAGARRFNLRRLNVPQRRMRTLVRESLEAGHAVGFSADVDRNDIDNRTGIMHPAIFNRTRVYGARVIRDLPRREDIYLGTASSKHAMAIVGLDRPKPGSAAVKYRVANSWGADLGDKGIYHMYAEWFEENVFKLAVHDSVLDHREREAYAHPVAVPGGRFY